MHSEGFGGRTCVRLVLSRGRVVVDLRCRRGLVASHVRSLLGDPPILHKNDPDRRVPGVIPQVSRARVQAARVSFEKSVAQECLRTVKWLLKSLCTCVHSCTPSEIIWSVRWTWTTLVVLRLQTQRGILNMFEPVNLKRLKVQKVQLKRLKRCQNHMEPYVEAPPPTAFTSTA